jgi:mannose-1-phosphate guanylyltransferase
MNGIILAAGRGKRLRPITNYVPKPLLPIVNRPIIDITIARLRTAGIEHLGINLWYKAAEIALFLKKHAHITVATEHELLGTGGALRNFRDFVTSHFVMHNTDIVTNVDIWGALEVHMRKKPLATLVLTKNRSTDVVRVDREHCVTDFYDTAHDTCFTFTGIAVLSQEIFSYLPEQNVFSMIDVYKNILTNGKCIAAVVSDAAWYDIGTHEQYWHVHHDLQNRIVSIPEVSDIALQYVDKTSVVLSKKIDGFVTVGPRCHIAEPVHLQDTIVFAGTRLEKGVYTRTLLSNHFCIPV